MERLQKLLAQAGIASRRHGEEMILAGRVRVNNKVVTELGTQVDPDTVKILVDNQPVALESKAYFILNKPRGYISDRDDTAGMKTALDLIPDGRRLFAAGRLDLMSEGMLFLTNDGELANHLTHPRYEHEKEYLALVFGAPDDKTIERLERGILYDGEWMRADTAERAGRNQQVGEAGRDETWLRIILHEGKKRQIRHMCAALGHPVKRLIRVRMGALRLGDLKVGEWRKLTKDEISQIRQGRERSPQRSKGAARSKPAPQRSKRAGWAKPRGERKRNAPSRSLASDSSVHSVPKSPRAKNAPQRPEKSAPRERVAARSAQKPPRSPKRNSQFAPAKSKSKNLPRTNVRDRKP